VTKTTVVSILFLIVLSISGLPVLAQDGCDHDLSPVHDLLAAADAAWTRGDNVTALDAVAQARVLLEQIEAQCTLPSSSSSPVPGRPGATRILIHANELGSLMGLANLTKLSAAAYVNGYTVAVIDDQGAFLSELDKSDVAAAIYVGQVASDPGLRKLYDFVQEGGRILLMYDGSWLDRNALLQELYGVSLAAEKIEIQTRSSFLYRQSVLPPWLQAYSIGIPSLSNDLTAFFRVYLAVPPTWPGERGTAPGENAHARLLYYANPTATVTFWPLPLGGRYERTPLFFNDENIDYFDNEAAAIALLRHMMGQQ